MSIFKRFIGGKIFYVASYGSTLHGTDGDDVIDGNSDDNLIYGHDGDDTLSGNGGDDVLMGDAGSDTLNGGSGNDDLWGGSGDDQIDGGDGNDWIDGGSGDDGIDGGSGDDHIDAGNGDDQIDGGDGNDWIAGGSGDDGIDGGSGDDHIDGGYGDDQIDGGDGNDWIDGGYDDDQIDGGAGDDLIWGNYGNDIIDGGDGDDHIDGGSGDDEIDGGDGNDWIDGGNGADQIVGGAGDDYIYGGYGADQIDGGSGNDHVWGGYGDDMLTYVLTENVGSTDFYDGGHGSDTLHVLLSQSEFQDMAIRADLKELQWYAKFITPVETSFGLTATSFEKVEVEVEGFGIVNVDNAPPQPVDDTATTNEDVPLTISAADILSNDSDPDGDMLTLAGVGSDVLDGNGHVVGSAALNADGDVVVTTNANFSGMAHVEYSVDDGNGGNADGMGADARTASVHVTVNAVADTPQLSFGGDAGGEVNVEGNEDTAIPLDIMAALTDTDGSESLAIKITGVPDGAVLANASGALTPESDGSYLLGPADLGGLTVTPPADSDADFTLTVMATSTEGANGDSASVTQTIDVTVNAVADAPDLTVMDAAGDEDTAIPLDIAAALTDTDGSETLQVKITDVPDGATLANDSGALMPESDGSYLLGPGDLSGLTVTPPADSDADFTLTVMATSTEGANGDSASVTQMIDVTVNAVADAPDLTVMDAGGQENTAIPLDIAAALTDTDGSETLQVEITDVPDGATLANGSGELAPESDGSYLLAPDDLADLAVTPPLDSDADFTLTVMATSTEGANGDSASVTQTLDVTVTAPPAPVGLDGAIVLTDGPDAYNGGDGDDLVCALGGDDTISGGGGDDVLDGGAGNDFLNGDAGDDLLYGGGGDDSLDGGPGHDGMDGGDGNDIIQGGLDADIGIGGNGNDILLGGGGNDALAGNAGDDTIFGGDGDDRIVGGEGNDVMSGGAGNDGFYFVQNENAVPSFDTITDFAAGDVIHLCGELSFAPTKIEVVNAETSGSLENDDIRLALSDGSIVILLNARDAFGLNAGDVEEDPVNPFNLNQIVSNHPDQFAWAADWDAPSIPAAPPCDLADPLDPWSDQQPPAVDIVAGTA